MKPEAKLLFDKGYEFLLQEGFSPREAKIQSKRLLLHQLESSNLEEVNVNESSEEQFFSLLKERISGKPLQYIEGTSQFMDFSFQINPQVLIPRPETENLVEVILEVLKDKKEEKFSFLELGVGSGCILLSLLKYFSKSKGVGVDRSLKAIEVAQKNINNLDLEKRALLKQSNWFDSLGQSTFDVLVSNPPYIANEDWVGLEKEVREEPKEALLAGPSGLECYEEIISKAKKFLNPNGFVFFEVGWEQADRVCGLLQQAGFEKIEKFLDDCGIERIVKAQHIK